MQNLFINKNKAELLYDTVNLRVFITRNTWQRYTVNSDNVDIFVNVAKSSHTSDIVLLFTMDVTVILQIHRSRILTNLC